MRLYLDLLCLAGMINDDKVTFKKTIFN